MALGALCSKVKKEEIFKRNHMVSLKLFFAYFLSRQKVWRLSETSAASRRLIKNKHYKEELRRLWSSKLNKFPTIRIFPQRYPHTMSKMNDAKDP